MRSERRYQPNIAISSWTVACIEWYDCFLDWPNLAAPNWPTISTMPRLAFEA
jgi:hypothetical protein